MSTVRLNAPQRATAVGGAAWLTPLAGHWVDAACRHLASRPAVVRVTVVALRGSAPREPGASMLVDPRATLGTIGGGHLEWHATRAARQLLIARGGAQVRIENLILGPELGQCCGGRVELWLERLNRRDLPWLKAASQRARATGADALETRVADGAVTHRVCPISGPAGVTLRRETAAQTLIEPLGEQRTPLWIFGAGHVGQALVRLLAELALFEIRWIDSRPEILPASLPEGVSTQACAAPAALLAEARPHTSYIVMTHDHALDFELCRAILERGDAAWLGLIGSVSKAARFRSRLARAGVAPERLAGLTCPIGVPGLSSKLPAAIAIAIAAQLLQRAGTAAAANSRGAAGDDALACDGTRGGCGTCGPARRERT
jgi:xanthine dehydrogenase accessory factor